VTSGSGDSRMLGGVPVFGDAASAAKTRGPLTPEPTRGAGDGRGGRPATTGTGAQARQSTVGVAAATKAPRRARLTVKRIDPWSMLKFSFVYGLAGMVVLLVAVVVLYGVVDAMGVVSSLRSFLVDVNSNPTGGGLAVWLTFDRVMLVAAAIGLINVVLFTAFATLTAFIYNVCTDIVGGVEVTLSERK
jgi:Transmembrane domain of unknown function (DUF3566)